MTAKPQRSLQSRLLVLVLAVVAVVWLSTAVMTWMDARHTLDELLDSHLEQAAALLSAQRAETLEEDRAFDAPKVAFQVFRDGRLVLRSANAPATPMVNAGKNFKTGFATVPIGGNPWRVFTAVGAARDVQIYVGERMESRAAILWAVLRITLLPMAMALPLLALALWWAVNRGVEPMRQLGIALGQRLPEALQPLSLDGAPAEVVPMVVALNGLLVRISKLLETERRFTADAAHELRTPIAAIRAQAQVALLQSQPQLRQQALQHTLEGCDRATRLVEQLLTLSRLEAAQALEMGIVDLSAVARQVVGGLAAKALGKRQCLELDAPEPCPVAGDATLLAVLVRNLVDNAVRYSPVGAHIVVSLPTAKGDALMRVQDSGPGLSDTDRARLGERFFRVLGTAQNGSGLGWSIARRIASAHRLEVHATPSQILGGLCAEVRAIADTTLT